MNDQTRQLDTRSLAVLHQAGRQWSVLVADISGPRPRITATRRFDDTDAESIDPWLETHQVGEVLAVVPASSVICRTCTLPDADPVQLEQGLELQAEAHLNGIAPPHRTAMAVLPAATGETSRSGLVLAWPVSSEIDLPPLNRKVLFTADVAALTALLNGTRPEDPLLWVDRNSDTIALAMTHANGVAIRATREHCGDSAEFTRGVQRALVETALNVGHSTGYIESLRESTAGPIGSLDSDEAVFIAPEELHDSLADRLDGAGRDAAWWSHYGIGVGALLARTGELASLTTMIRDQPTHAPSIIHQVTERLSQPRTSVIVVAAAVLALALSPLLFNGVRLGLLKLRFNSLDERIEQVERARHSLTMYEELEEQAWPMTKLLADIANCTPLGIELENIRIRQGQMFSLAGKASPRDGYDATQLISMMEKQLRDTGIFSEVVFGWKDPTANYQYEFDMTGRIVRPHRIARYDIEQEFGKWTHEMRRNGDPPPGEDDAPGTSAVADGAGSEAATASGALPKNAQASAGGQTNTAGKTSDFSDATVRGATERGDSVRPRERPERFIGQPERPDSDEFGSVQSRAALDPAALPEFLSESTISTLSKQETMDRLAQVSKAKQRWKSDEETFAKLDEQFKLLLAHLKEVK